MYPRINPRQLSQAMRQLGISQENIEAEEVIIRCKDKNIRITTPHVIKIKMGGEDSFQISGRITEENLPPIPEISEEDIEMVMQGASVSRKEAEKALIASKGDIAAAILSLKK
ncbi:MAG: nascent polypeptide-associated complex protein [Candidatus Woesearchaeota archaeon]